MISFILLAAALVFTPKDADWAYRTADHFVRNFTPRDAGTIRGKLAANYILDETSKTGADMRRVNFTSETPDGERSFSNLECDFQTSLGSNWVVIVSHFDTKSGVSCPGANDGAASSALLMSIARVLIAADDFHGNVMLIWTDGEECFKQYDSNDGLWGSKHAAEQLRLSGRNVRAVICVDMIGDKDLKISIPSNVSDSLAKIALEAAKRKGLSAIVERSPNEVKDDHVSFLNQGFNAIDLIDFEYGPGNSYWHTSEDTMEHVSRESLLKSGQLLIELLNILL